MFARWGDLVYRMRFTVIGVMVAALLGFAAYGADLNDHLSQSGWDDPGSESAEAARLADTTFGRDKQGDVIVLYTAPEGKTVDDPDFNAKVTDSLNSLVSDHPEQIEKINGTYFKLNGVVSANALATEDRTHAIASVAMLGANDTELTNNFQAAKDAFYIDGVDVQVTGLQAVAGALQSTMAGDIHRMELLAIPAVAILLFFIFGGVVAAALPLIIGGLTVVGANGIVKMFTNFTEINSFVAPVVSLVGLGLAIDYGLFIVSRFREELGDGYTPKQAVRRSVMTAGRTVVFSATMIVASLGGLLLFPQGFLKSVAYGSIATVALAALTAITILPAMLAVLGTRVDALGLKFMRKTKSSEEIENGVWGKLTRWVMNNPLKVVIPIVLGLVLLTLPVGNIKFGGINETYLPPDNVTRQAQNEFDELFPGQRTEPIKLVVENAQGANLGSITSQANGAPGLIEKFTPNGASKDGIIVFKAGLVDRNDSKPAIDYLRSIDVPDGATVMVTGTPVIEQDSISALIDNLPLMALLVVFIVTLLMFLTFGSLVLPIKAVLMTTLGLGATMGILTWIFIDGNGASFMNFTPGPIMAPVLVLIISIVFGLSTDYEVFLLSRMVEAREKGASTSEAIRIGTSHTGRIITAAALILIVVTGAFAFSDLVMMKYIAYGMIAALIIDATLIRMFLVPATMKLLGDDCWWAPQWMKRIQRKLGLGETILEDEFIPMDVPELAMAGAAPLSPAMPPNTASPHRPAPRRNEPLTEPIPVVAPVGSGPIRATHTAQENARRSATGKPAHAPKDEHSIPEVKRQVPPPPAPEPRPAAPDPRPAAPQPREAMPTNGSNGKHPITPDPRSIEGWLADLRAPTDKPRNEPARSDTRRADAQRSESQSSESQSSQTQSFEAQSSDKQAPEKTPEDRPVVRSRDESVSNGAAASGGASAHTGYYPHGRNGSSSTGTNGSRSSRNGSNGSASSSSSSTPRPGYSIGADSSGTSGNYERTNNGGVRGYSSPSNSTSNGTGSNGSSGGANGNARDEHPSSTPIKPTTSSSPRARYDITTRNAPRPAEPAPPEPTAAEPTAAEPTAPASEPTSSRLTGPAREHRESPAPRSSRRGADTRSAEASESDADSGRHRGGDGRPALSVSDLLAREKRK
ncbi:MMPL family transporter [Rhodococcus sp. G-MC3]|uniref:MMPL family transporter n=1 Tax=Rhodococcus sp. G-MC3 TaxID=3046209 RepID=UPI0024BBD6DE|nr:MMPL family transporter [Rhodococcus sp. G-MC3]MDJ0394730.1 MMPL family transporter [Rhodococcus sp. G-MC3]